FDKARLVDNYRCFRAALPTVAIHYAVKCLSDSSVLNTLLAQGSHFEIASTRELDLLLAQGVKPQHILYSNPIKSPAAIRYAADRGVQWYAVDSTDELLKIAAITPDARCYLRIHTSNDGAMWPLEEKFGARRREIDAILSTAAEHRVQLVGVTFHVGSQCLNPDNWRRGIRTARAVFEAMKALGITAQLLNIGGGFPAAIGSDVPTIETIAAVINEELAALDPQLKVVAEPGRYLVASAGCLVCRVIGTAVRSGQRWLYLDTGTYGGLMEMAEGFRYPMITERRGAVADWTVAGPTCDAVDICSKQVSLPVDLQSDDFVYIVYAGAYTITSASTFNGFAKPRLIAFDSRSG
ncbi:MAG: type III PLP-dependent enzyme, partial [Opitutales bacterium]|nr:type III PLP-dependent enzyme [Opitutales bacterium]